MTAEERCALQTSADASQKRDIVAIGSSVVNTETCQSQQLHLEISIACEKVYNTNHILEACPFP